MDNNSTKQIFDELSKSIDKLSLSQYKAPRTPSGRFIEPSIYTKKDVVYSTSNQSVAITRK